MEVSDENSKIRMFHHFLCLVVWGNPIGQVTSGNQENKLDQGEGDEIVLTLM